MKDCSLFGLLGQASGNETAAVFQSFIRGHVRSLICRVMSDEMENLCGPKHQPGTGKRSTIFLRTTTYAIPATHQKSTPISRAVSSSARFTVERSDNF